MRISDWSSDVCSSDLNPSLGSSAGRKNGLSLSDMSLALGMSKTRPSNLLSAEAEHALSKLTIDKEAAVRCLFMPAGYERSATSTTIGRAHVCTPVTNAHPVCSLLLDKKQHTIHK